MPPPNPIRAPDLVEDAIGRLREAIAILDAIEEAGMLGELPMKPTGRRNHQRAVSLLAVLRRELDGLVCDLTAAGQVQDAIARMAVRDRS